MYSIMTQDMSNSSSEEGLSTRKRRGRPAHATWRIQEDGTYNDKPLDPEYFKLYARGHAMVKVVCPLCQSTVNRQELNLHQQRPICERRRQNMI